MTPKISIQHLTKEYGAAKAVNDLSLDVAPGTVFGLLGRNGAGKTTVFGCALGLVHASSGRVLFDGQPLSVASLASIAYVPETPALYEWMTGREHLEMQRRTYPAFDVAFADELAGRFELSLEKKIRTLSKGQKTGVALVLAFAQRPAVMVLDEPSSGLDPLMQHRLLDLVVQASADGTTVVFSSHQIGQVERAAEDVAIVDRGRVVLTGNLDELRSSHKVVEAVFAGVPSAKDLRQHEGVLTLDVHGNMLEVRTSSHVEEIVAAIEALRPDSLRILDRSLEDVFLRSIDATPKVAV
jgi:ABC-2 type transport system ATP-binding protein